MSDPAADDWQELTRQATVALEVPSGGRAGPRRGTGFVVAPGVVATCAHVLADADAPLPARVEGRLIALGRDLRLTCDRDWYFRDTAGLDLALLRVEDDGGAEPALLSPVMRLGDEMWTYGHPDTRFRAGQPATFTFQGTSRRSTEQVFELPRVHGVPVGPGFSGSPVVNPRTGAVCGMLSTSDNRGSAHLISAAEILARCPESRHADGPPPSHRRWLSTLTDEQIRSGGWRFPGPRLRAYLDAASRAARDHPYPGVIPGTKPPPLAAVYVRQRAQPAGDKDAEADAGARGSAIPARAVMDLDHDCLVIAGPGAGKSSLLRNGVIEAVRHWDDGLAGTEIPVRVQALDLMAARPLPAAIAAAVTAELSAVGSLEAWPPEFFAAEPLRGVRWLVLVDGLDEVTDPAARSAVLAKLTGIADARPSLPYRFVVASRPLPGTELSWPHRFELLPFDGRQVGRFAESWFTALSLPDPRAAAAEFLAALKRNGLAEMVRTPLMATMLCQLYVQDTGRPLPTGRYDAYRRFVDLVQARQREAGLDAQTRASLAGWPGAAEAAAGILATLPDHLARLAAHRLEGDTTPAVARLTAWTAGDRPGRVPDQVWDRLLNELLRRSGLLVERSGDFSYLHQTIAEFLAARHTAGDAKATGVAYDRLVNYHWPPRHERSWSAEWRPKLDDSYAGFLVAAWLDTPTLPKGARRLPRALRGIARSGIEGCRFIVRRIDEGTSLPQDVSKAVADALAKLAADPRAHQGPLASFYSDAPVAAGLLAGLGDPRGKELLAAMSAGHPHVQPGQFLPVDRIAAARELAELGDERGVESLATTAGCAHCTSVARQRAAIALDAVGDTRGADVLAAMLEAGHSLEADSFDYWGYVKVATALAERDDPRGREILAALAGRPDLVNDPFNSVILPLTRLDPRRAAEMLGQAAENPLYTEYERVRAAEALAAMGDPRGAELLMAIVGSDDPAYNGPVEAAEALAGLGDPRGPDLLATIADDHTVAACIEAAEILIELGDPRGQESLAAITLDTSASIIRRVEAARALAWRNDPRGLDALAKMAADRSLDRVSRKYVRASLASCRLRLRSRDNP